MLTISAIEKKRILLKVYFSREYRMPLSADILLDKIEWTTCIKLDTKPTEQLQISTQISWRKTLIFRLHWLFTVICRSTWDVVTNWKSNTDVIKVLKVLTVLMHFPAKRFHLTPRYRYIILFDCVLILKIEFKNSNGIFDVHHAWIHR